MKAKYICTSIFMICLLGCGAVTNSDPQAPLPPFHNETKASDADLMKEWAVAQQTIATVEIDMNPVTRLLFPGTPAITAPPDPRALNITPRGVTVVAVPDIPVSQLILQNSAWGGHTDPSGVIDCGAQLLAHSCVDIQANTVYSASSLVPQALEWEFENIILNSLGYDVSGR